MTEETPAARAARKSREWKARQAEIAEAAREDEEIRQKRRARAAREQRETYQDGAWRNIILIVGGALFAFLLYERMSIANAAEDCLEGARHLHQYNCAVTLTKSFWSWLIPSGDAELLRNSATLNQ